ncbi:hypothetical protein Agub_g6329 [Astrephomene gubernaculifera]|uniref:ADP-ribosylation factor-like protein 16 n=1 Tax=Astrephomene gubernaculifera TaxID=47775 RepID=A0AAD3HLD8_9CHLO|nr:hypothetical protein Agub_g6329 [Astrephomene gubernaculifera]
MSWCMRNSALCCSHETVESPTKDTDDVLLVGLQGSGKTLLGQRLRTVYGKAQTPFRAATTPTNGCQDFRVPTRKGCPFKEIRIRECGGSMQPLWGHWYDRPLSAVLLAVDGADPGGLAAAGVVLQGLLEHPSLASTPVCVVLTKSDLPGVLAPPQLEAGLGLQQLQVQAQQPGRLRVTRVSSVQELAECPQLGELVDWMAEVKALKAWREQLRQGMQQQ